jgi:hypothetical protein
MFLNDRRKLNIVVNLLFTCLKLIFTLQLSKYRKNCCQMVRFEGTSMLQKAVPTCKIVNQSIESIGLCRKE